jgi:hypothetical protein
MPDLTLFRNRPVRELADNGRLKKLPWPVLISRTPKTTIKPSFAKLARCIWPIDSEPQMGPNT